MATTATTAVLAAPVYSDNIVPVSASGVGGATATKGDWIIASASWAIPAVPGTIGSPAYRVSALGLAVQNNPTFTPQGVAINNTAFAVARRGLVRVTASGSGTAGTFSIGSFVYPTTTSSGIVGQTGATGVSPLWQTAPPCGISANPTGALFSGVAIIVNHFKGGDVGVGQMDIVFDLATNAGWI